MGKMADQMAGRRRAELPARLGSLTDDVVIELPRGERGSAPVFRLIVIRQHGILARTRNALMPVAAQTETVAREMMDVG